MPQRHRLEIDIVADDQASHVIKGVADNTRTLGVIATGAVVAGAAAASAAVLKFSVDSLETFSSFENSMNEVFTLLPGITAEAMDGMSYEVKRFAQVFGTLPNELIPALYQALSAGVPQNNVFDFLEVAQKAAIGGVTELETAVDGITSVVNAYGAEVLSAAEASDLMFTTVRLGKTDFDQLSRNLFQVIPTAAALGIEFADISAAAATLTASGTPTSVALTQIRQALVELSKPGSETAKIFEEMAGKTLKEFIAEGNNLQDALQLMEKAAQEAGIDINGLFSSVEAGNAVLGLTGNQTQRFSDALDAMGESTGATEDAFNRMNNGIQRSGERFQAAFSVLKTTFGERVAPLFQPLIDTVTAVINVINAFLEDGETLSDWMQDVPTAVQPFVRGLLVVLDAIGTFAREFGRFVGAVSAGVPFFDALRVHLNNLLPQSVVDTLFGLIDALRVLWQVVLDITAPIREWIAANVGLQDVLAAVGFVIASVVLPALLSVAGALAPLILTFGAIVGAIAILRKAWEDDFLGIRTAVTNVVEPLIEFFGALADGVDPMTAIKDLLANFLSEEQISSIIAFFTDLKMRFDDAVAGIRDFVAEAMPFIMTLGVAGTAVAVVIGILWGLHAVVTATITGVGILGAAIGVLLSPVVLLTAGILALLAALNSAYPGGLIGLLTDAATTAQQLAVIFRVTLGRAVQWLKDRVAELVEFFQNLKTEVDKFLEVWSGIGANAQTIFEKLFSGDVTPGELFDAIKNAIGSEIGGAANGAIVTSPQMLMVGERLRGPNDFEAVLNSDQLNALTNSRGGGNTVNIYLTGPRSQAEANIQGQMIVDGLRSAGVDL